ncbi:hypothetical protein KCU81_g8827, partial [Aureobasidium melanogenum]
MRDAIQETSSGFEALSDASASSTCTLTPASVSQPKEIRENPTKSEQTVVNEPLGKSSNDDHVRSVVLELQIAVYYDLVHIVGDGLRHPAFHHPLLVRTNSNTPFKVLKDKLRDRYYERNGEMDLRLKQSPLKCLFGSDTPTSLELTEGVELMYARINGAVKTIDLTT